MQTALARFESAATSLASAYTIDPDSTDPLSSFTRNSGQMQTALARFESAAASLESASSIAPVISPLSSAVVSAVSSSAVSAAPAASIAPVASAASSVQSNESAVPSANEEQQFVAPEAGDDFSDESISDWFDDRRPAYNPDADSDVAVVDSPAPAGNRRLLRDSNSGLLAKFEVVTFEEASLKGFEFIEEQPIDSGSSCSVSDKLKCRWCQEYCLVENKPWIHISISKGSPTTNQCGQLTCLCCLDKDRKRIEHERELYAYPTKVQTCLGCTLPLDCRKSGATHLVLAGLPVDRSIYYLLNQLVVECVKCHLQLKVSERASHTTADCQDRILTAAQEHTQAIERMLQEIGPRAQQMQRYEQRMKDMICSRDNLLKEIEEQQALMSKIEGEINPLRASLNQRKRQRDEFTANATQHNMRVD